MRQENKEIIKISSKELLLSMFDLAVPFFQSSRYYRINTKIYSKDRELERSNFLDKIKYLKRTGLINNFIEGKEKYLEITPMGLARISKYSFDVLDIERSQKWDGKWRVVIFDIPEDHKGARNAFRSKLNRLGFEKIQQSVYVYPFECTKEIRQLSSTLFESENILIMVSEIIENENKIIAKFLEKNILLKSDLKSLPLQND